jgi:signal peptidase I
MPSTLFRTFVFVAVVVGLMVLVLRLTCLRWWQVPQDDADLAASVAPTLGPGDWVILWRATPPGFGDLVLCPDPEDPAQVFVGRIAGEAHDTLSIDESGSITVNNSRAKSEHACDPWRITVPHPTSGDEVEQRCDIETLGGVHHKRALIPDKAALRPGTLNKRRIEAGSVYLISDNRLFPFDSRDFGPLPEASCKETVLFRLVSRLGFSDVEHRLDWIQ